MGPLRPDVRLSGIGLAHIHNPSVLGMLVCMEIDVREAAGRMGVSERRVRQLAAADRLPGRRLGGRWLVDEVAAFDSRPVARPMSERMAWAMVAAISGDDAHDISPTERHRVSSKHRRLTASPDAAHLLRSWLPRRSELRKLSASPQDLDELRSDPRALLSGISDQRSGMSSGSEVELYVRRSEADTLVRDFLLSDKGRPNVWLHISNRRLPSVPPLGLVVADLADHNGPREDGQAVALLRKTMSE